MIVLQHENETIRLDFSETIISPTLEIEDKDQSGDSSSSFSTSGGIKPWHISVSCLVKESEDKELLTLISAARKVDSKMNPVPWLITESNLNALAIRQVKFVGQIAVKKVDSLFARTLSFSLKEINSIPEKTEIKKLGPLVKVDGKAIDSKNTTQEVVQALTKDLYDPYASLKVV